MKHVVKVSAIQNRLSGVPGATPQPADAKTDFMDAVYNAWTDFVYQKKNELSL